MYQTEGILGFHSILDLYLGSNSWKHLRAENKMRDLLFVEFQWRSKLAEFVVHLKWLNLFFVELKILERPKGFTPGIAGLNGPRLRPPRQEGGARSLTAPKKPIWQRGCSGLRPSWPPPADMLEIRPPPPSWIRH